MVFLNPSLIWGNVSNLKVSLFNLESFVFLVKVGVALFDLESMGTINTPLMYYFIINSSLMIKKLLNLEIWKV